MFQHIYTQAQEATPSHTQKTYDRIPSSRGHATPLDTLHQMKHFDETRFIAEISSNDWNPVLQSNMDLDSAVENWTNLFSLIIEKHAPMRQRRVSEKYCPWVTSDFKALARSRDKLKKSAMKTGTEILMVAYRRLRNKVNSQNTRLKRACFSEKTSASEGNLKETWNTINELINKRSKSTNISSLTVEDKRITKNNEMAFPLSHIYLRGLFLIKCISTLLQINYSSQTNRVSGLCTLY